MITMYLLTQAEDSLIWKIQLPILTELDVLIKSESPELTESFASDPAGKLIDPIATQSAQVKDNLIRQYQGKHYKYDAQGNIIQSTQGDKTLKY